MKKYTVIMPFAGAITLTIEAKSEAEAKENFYKKVDNKITFDRKALEEIEAVAEWDFYTKITEGNVCNAEYSEMEIFED